MTDYLHSRGVEPPPLPQVNEARRERRLAAVCGAVGLAVFLVAAVLNPYDVAGMPRSHGTHRQLGLPTCRLQALAGFRCPTCGMTTSFSLLMHGDLTAAWRTNWAGCIVAAMALSASLWFVAVAAGVPPGGITADRIIQAMVASGSLVAMLRWLATIAFRLLV